MNSSGLPRDQGVQTAVLKQQETEAVLGVATWGLDAVWPGQCLVDIYCHPEYWSWGDDLLAAIVLPKMHRYVAYCDVGFAAKEAVLEGAGFERVATLAGWVPVDRAETAFADVGVWERK